jgi:antitoxin component YwqK of YwqJK toxin-antitoxin module
MLSLKLLFAFLFIAFGSLFAQVGDPINQMDKAGLRQGKWIKKDEQGKLIYSGAFLNNYPVGTFTYYYPTGTVKSITTFYIKKDQAYTTLFNTDGKKISQGKIIGEKKDSTWTYFAGKDTVASIENYSLGQKQGVFLAYFNNGKTRWEILYANGLRNGKAKFYFPTGTLNSEGNYLNDLEDGKWNYYEEDGTLDWQVMYKKGTNVKSTRFNGVEELNYPDNIPKSKISYKNGLKNGSFTEYYDLGEIIIETVPPNDGYPEDHQEKIKDQKISRSGNYLNDKLEGKITYYKQDGTIDKEETYKNGINVQR